MKFYTNILKIINSLIKLEENMNVYRLAAGFTVSHLLQKYHTFFKTLIKGCFKAAVKTT